MALLIPVNGTCLVSVQGPVIFFKERFTRPSEVGPLDLETMEGEACAGAARVISWGRKLP